MSKANNKGTAVLIVNFEHISKLFLVFLLLTLSRQMPVRESGAENALKTKQKIIAEKA